MLKVGLTGGIILQAFLNIGVITALFPFTGIPLPFVSYGGSSLVATLASIGILLSIGRHDVRWRQPDARLRASRSLAALAGRP